MEGEQSVEVARFLGGDERPKNRWQPGSDGRGRVLGSGRRPPGRQGDTETAGTKSGEGDAT
jgi:hypothetical protein